MPMLRFRRADHLFVVCVLLPLVICGCPPADIPSGSTASDEERLASLAQAQQAVDSIGLDGDPAKTDQIAEMLKAMPVFDRVEAGDGVVFAHFTDGQALIVMNNRPGVDADAAAAQTLRVASPADGFRPAPTARALSPADRRSPLASAIDGKKFTMPESSKAVLVNTMGTNYCDLTPQIGGWLAKVGYAISNLDGSVDSLRTGVTNVGVLYYNGHGSVVPNWMLPFGLAPLVPGFEHFGLWTRTPVTADNLPAYRSELESGFLVYGLCPTDRIAGNLTDCLDHKDEEVRSEFHYCITDYFINRYWRCAEGSLLYIDACHGAQADSMLPELCLMPDVNASVVVGWTAGVLDPWATPTALFFFDRLLGANEYPPLHAPPQRPFTVNATLAAMKGVYRGNLPMDQSKSYKGLFVVQVEDAPRYIASLVAVYADDTDDIALRPGIKQLTVNEGQRRVIFEGDFGDGPATATLNGSALPLSGDGSTPNRIECDLPQDSAGEAIVTVAGRASNPRRLTQWNLTFHQLFMDYPTQQSTDCPSCFYEATIHYTIRADVGGVRSLPEENVSPPGFVGPASDGDIEVTNAGGSFFIGQGSTITLAPNPNDGAAFIGTCIGFLPPFDNNYLGACFHLDGAASLIRFSPTLSAEGLFRNYTGGTYDGIVDPYQVLYLGNIVGRELLLSLTPNYTISAGQQATGPNSYFQWEAADAISPTQSDDPR